MILLLDGEMGKNIVWNSLMVTGFLVSWTYLLSADKNIFFSASTIRVTLFVVQVHVFGIIGTLLPNSYILVSVLIWFLNGYWMSSYNGWLRDYRISIENKRKIDN